MQWLNKRPVILLLLLGVLGGSNLARIKAAIIDTFDFTQNWIEGSSSGMLTGSFTGTVEPSGLIQIGDVTRFSVQLALSNAAVQIYPYLSPPPLSNGSPVFSYNINGGPSSLTFIAENQFGSDLLCEGSVAVLFCNAPSNSFGDRLTEGGVSYQQASLMLISSITTNPGSPGTAPEPASVWLMAGGLALAGVSRIALSRGRRS